MRKIINTLYFPIESNENILLPSKSPANIELSDLSTKTDLIKYAGLQKLLKDQYLRFFFFLSSTNTDLSKVFAIIKFPFESMSIS